MLQDVSVQLLEFFEKMRRVFQIIWCIRYSNINVCYEKTSIYITNKYYAIFSWKIDMVLYNGNVVWEKHEKMCGKILIVIM